MPSEEPDAALAQLLETLSPAEVVSSEVIGPCYHTMIDA